jgi:hypothetical protein
MIMAMRPQGSGPLDQLIWEQLETHIEAEKNILDDYRRFAEVAETPEVRYLIGLILDDELRHHRTFRDLANAVRGAIEWREIEPRVPDRGYLPLSSDLLDRTKRFIAVEEEDLRQLGTLRRQLQPVHKTTLWPLLVELMELDTKKHLRILEFIAERCKD